MKNGYNFDQGPKTAQNCNSRQNGGESTHSNSIKRKAELHFHFSAALLLESVQKVVSVWTQAECGDGQPLQLRGGGTVSPPLPSCLNKELSSGQHTVGRGVFCQVCVCLCLCLTVWHCVWYSHMYVWTCVCECICVRRLDQRAVATAGSTSCVLVSELDSSTMALTLP